MTKRILLCFLVLLTFVISGASVAQNRTITPDMIEQAKKAGFDVSSMGSALSGKSINTQGINRSNLKDGGSESKNQNSSQTGNYSNYIRNTTKFRNQNAIDLGRKRAEIKLMLLPDSVLRDSILKLTRMMEPKEQKIFGRDIFWSRNLTFSPDYNMPTPANYILGSGDVLFIDVTGSATANDELEVSPDGTILIPEAGIINVAGMTVEAARQRIKNHLAQYISGIEDGSSKVTVSLGNVRSIKVNIIGEALLPGTYTLPSLATLFNAIYAAGGVSDIGSLRDIRLIRDGKQIASLDVYDYLIKGKQEVNMGLKDNDMIVISPYENLVSAAGRVKRPIRYEMRKNETVADLINYSGGFTGDAYTEIVSVDRKAGRKKSIYSVPVKEFADFTLADGDSITISEVIDKYENRLNISGAVWRPGNYQFDDSTNTVLKLISRAQGLRGDALLSRSQIIRQRPDLEFEVISVDLGALVNGRLPDVELQAEDMLSIPSINSLKEKQNISVKGEVNHPDTIMPYRYNMTIQDAIMLAGGLKESASLARIEVVRRVKNPHATTTDGRIAEPFSFTIPEDMVIDPATADFKLEPFDQVFIRPSPGYSSQLSVFVQGEVIFPGEYVLSSSYDRVSDLISKSGGMAPEAYPKGAYINRKVTEDRLARIRTLESLSNRGKAVLGDTVMADKIKKGDYYPIAIDLVSILTNPSGTDNLILQQGDQLIIPKYNSTVTISGAVLYPCVISYTEGDKIKDYIVKGGGYANRAKKRPFIIYANGMPLSRKAGVNPRVEPGCEIVVPQKEAKRGMGAGEIISMTSSMVSVLAVISSLIPR